MVSVKFGKFLPQAKKQIIGQVTYKFEGVNIASYTVIDFKGKKKTDYVRIIDNIGININIDS